MHFATARLAISCRDAVALKLVDESAAPGRQAVQVASDFSARRTGSRYSTRDDIRLPRDYVLGTRRFDAERQSVPAVDTRATSSRSPPPLVFTTRAPTGNPCAHNTFLLAGVEKAANAKTCHPSCSARSLPPGLHGYCQIPILLILEPALHIHLRAGAAFENSLPACRFTRMKAAHEKRNPRPAVPSCHR